MYNFPVLPRFKYTGFNISFHAGHVKGGAPMSRTGVLRALKSQQRATEWRPQSEVKQSLDLEEEEIRHFFKRLGEARRSQ